MYSKLPYQQEEGAVPSLEQVEVAEEELGRQHTVVTYRDRIGTLKKCSCFLSYCVVTGRENVGG